MVNPSNHAGLLVTVVVRVDSPVEVEMGSIVTTKLVAEQVEES